MGEHGIVFRFYRFTLYFTLFLHNINCLFALFQLSVIEDAR